MSVLTIDKFDLTEKEFQVVSQIVYEHCGINLHDGKKELVRARLAKLIRQHHCQSVNAYLDYVFSDPTKIAFFELIDALSTNLTSFFREQKHFVYLTEHLLPELFVRKQKLGKRKIRCWSAGCSTGEEPYSMAITLLEAAESQGIFDIKVLATDISQTVLEKARKGLYDEQRVRTIPTLLKQKYFKIHPGKPSKSYEVKPQLKQSVVFKYLNLLEDWPFRGPLDFIFCRNVMIYFDKPTQEKLINRFWDILDSGGFLFTGHSESLTGIQHQFSYVQPTIYVKP